MKNKFKNWWNKPITRGDYTKWCLVSVGLSALYGLVVYAYLNARSKEESLEFDSPKVEFNLENI